MIALYPELESACRSPAAVPSTLLDLKIVCANVGEDWLSKSKFDRSVHILNKRLGKRDMWSSRVGHRPPER